MDVLRATGYPLAASECPFPWLQAAFTSAGSAPTENNDQTALRRSYLLSLYQPELLCSIDGLAQDLLASGSLSNIPADSSVLPLILDLQQIENKHRKTVAAFVERWMTQRATGEQAPGLDPPPTSEPRQRKKGKRAGAIQPVELEEDELYYLTQGLQLRCDCAASDSELVWRSVRKGTSSTSDDSVMQSIKSVTRQLVGEFERRETMIQLVLLFVHLHYQAKPAKRPVAPESGSSSKARSELDKTDDFSLWRLADMLTDRLALWQAIGGFAPSLLVRLGGEADEWDWVQRFCGGIIEQRFLAVHVKFVANFHVKAFGTPLPSLKSSSLGRSASSRVRRASNDSTLTRMSRASSVASSARTDNVDAERKLSTEDTRPRMSRAASTQALFKNRQINLAKPISRATSNGPSSAMAGLIRAGMDAIPGKRKTMFVPKVTSVPEESAVRALVEATPARPRIYSTLGRRPALPPATLAIAETPQSDRTFARPAAPDFAVRRRTSESMDFTAQVDQTPLKDFMVESDEEDSGTPFLGAKPGA